METEPPLEGNPENKARGGDGGAPARGGDSSGVRVVAADKSEAAAPPSQLVARLTPEKVRRPSAPLVVAEVRPAPLSGAAVCTESAEPLSVNPDPEPTWGAKTPPPIGRLWLGLAVGSLAMVLVGAVLLLPRPGDSAAPRNVVVKPIKVAEDRLQWFRQNPDQADKQADALLKAYTHATTVEEVLGLVREPQRVERLLRERWQPLGSPLRADQPDMLREFSAVGGVAFYLMTAELEDFRKLRVYFVRENGSMSIDWEASVAHSSVPWAQLENAPGLRDVQLRCSIEAQAISIPHYPASEYNGYLLVVPGNQEALWGLARIGGEADEALLDALDRGRFLLDLKTRQRVSVEIEEAPGAPSNYFIIKSLNHIEWVAP